MGDAAYILDQELINEFVAECTEMLDMAEPEMLSSACIDQDLANKIFRPLHSMKGVAGSFGLNIIGQVAHAAETFLSIFRNENVKSSDESHLSLFLKSFDFFRTVLRYVEERGTDLGYEADAKQLIGQFELTTKDLLSESASVQTPPALEIVPQENLAFDKIEISQEMIDSFKTESLEAFDHIEQGLMLLAQNPSDLTPLEDSYRYMHSFKGNCGIFSLTHLEKLGHRLENTFDSLRNKKIESSSDIYDSIVKIIDILRETTSSLEAGSQGEIENLEMYLNQVDALTQAKGQAGPLPEQAQVKSNTNSFKQQDIRVNITKLDLLNNYVGELVTARTMVQENIRATETNESIEKALHFLSKTIHDIQDLAMDIRMVPIAGLFNKMIRIVHDLSKKSQKNINLSFFGENTEIDKTLMEKISDPLVHMIRNSVDHGIESPADRSAAGKSAQGNITLGASQEAGEVWIIIKDDGHGLDRDKIIKKAIEQNLISSGDELSDQEAFSLIYRPGFSTAEKITDISGRGVGMDVVTQNIKDVKGRIEVNSQKNEGSTFTIKIPLTLAIIDGMLLRVGAIKYTLPVESIQEIVKVTRKEIQTLMAEQELIKIRDNLVPVVSLGKLHKNTAQCNLEDGIIVIISANGNKIALLIDELIGQQQTVVKPLPDYFEEMQGISSCSILGNGEVSLILDVRSLIDCATRKDPQ